MTAQTDAPTTLPGGEPSVASTRMPGLALHLFTDGLAVLAVAVLLGLAQALEVWMGALVVALVLMLLAAGTALVGLVGRLRPHLTLWS